MIEYRIALSHTRPGQMVEIHRDGKFIAAVYVDENPTVREAKSTIRIFSKHIVGSKLQEGLPPFLECYLNA